MARLGVNVECITELRKLERGGSPDPITAALYAEVGGADGIVYTLKEENNALYERDVRVLKEIVKTHLNIQVPPSERMISLILTVSPDMVTLIPGKKPGSTPEGGLDVLSRGDELTSVIQEIRSKNIVVSLLVEPIIHQVKAAVKTGADFIELHLGKYAKAEDFNERVDCLENISSVALAASKMSLGVAAGCRLDYNNVTDISAIENIEEINIGHSIIARALWIGMEQAVRDMVGLVH